MRRRYPSPSLACCPLSFLVFAPCIARVALLGCPLFSDILVLMSATCIPICNQTPIPIEPFFVPDIKSHGLNQSIITECPFPVESSTV